MTSKNSYNEAYVWVWLPARTEPVVAGLLSKSGNQLVFNYGQSYRQRADAIPIYLPELPLQPGILPLLPGLNMPSCIRDASPDAWGRRVLITRKLGLKGDAAANVELDELTYLLEFWLRPDWGAGFSELIVRLCPAPGTHCIVGRVD